MILGTYGSLPYGIGTFLGGTATRGAGPVYRVSNDPDFLTGMIHTADVLYDANAAGNIRGGRGGAKPNWQPMAGLEGIACRVVLRRPEPFEGAGKPGDLVMGRVLFGIAVPGGRGDLIRWAKPDGGTMDLYLVGPVIDAHGMSHHWFADITDQLL